MVKNNIVFTYAVLMLNDCSSIPHVYFMNLFSNGEYLRISEAQFKHARSAVCLHLQIQMIVCSALFEMFVLFKDTNFWICFNSVTWRSNWTVLVSGFALCLYLISLFHFSFRLMTGDKGSCVRHSSLESTHTDRQVLVLPFKQDHL